MGIILDLSSNNAHPINYPYAASQGVVGVIVKATEGTGYTNPYYAADAAGFAAAGVPVLAYHFASLGDPAAEAAHFVSVAGDRARVLDIETSTNATWSDEFLAALNLPAGELLTYGSASTLPRSGIRSLLWPASYGKNYGFGDCWQFTDAQVVPGIGGQVDASTWIGSQADFDALFGVTPPPAPGQPPVTYPGDSMIRVYVPLFTCDAAGWYARGVADLEGWPAGKTAEDIVSVVPKWASAFDPQGWQACAGSIDYAGERLVFHGAPSKAYDAYVWVAQ